MKANIGKSFLSVKHAFVLDKLKVLLTHKLVNGELHSALVVEAANEFFNEALIVDFRAYGDPALDRFLNL